MLTVAESRFYDNWMHEIKVYGVAHVCELSWIVSKFQQEIIFKQEARFHVAHVREIVLYC